MGRFLENIFLPEKRVKCMRKIYFSFQPWMPKCDNIWSHNSHPVWQLVRAPSDLLSKRLWRAPYSGHHCSIQKSQQGAPPWALPLHSLVVKCIRQTSSRRVKWKQLKLEKGAKLARLSNIKGKVWWGENAWEDGLHIQSQSDAMSFFSRKPPNEDKNTHPIADRWCMYLLIREENAMRLQTEKNHKVNSFKGIGNNACTFYAGGGKHWK